MKSSVWSNCFNTNTSPLKTCHSTLLWSNCFCFNTRHSTNLHIVPISQLSKLKIDQYTSERPRGLPQHSSVLAWRPTGWTHGGGGGGYGRCARGSHLSSLFLSLSGDFPFSFDVTSLQLVGFNNAALTMYMYHGLTRTQPHSQGGAGGGSGTARGPIIDVRGVDYSEHSSFDELRDFVCSLKVREKHPY